MTAHDRNEAQAAWSKLDRQWFWIRVNELTVVSMLAMLPGVLWWALT